MTIKLNELKAELTSTLHARQNPITPPQEIGLPKSGTMTFSEDVYLATYLYDVFSSGQANDIVPPYIATFADEPKRRDKVFAKQTFASEMIKALTVDQPVATAVKQAAYETMTFHASQDKLFSIDNLDKLNNMAQKIGFPDFDIAEQLLMKTPVALPSPIELVRDTVNKILATGDNKAAHGRRMHAVDAEERLSAQVYNRYLPDILIIPVNDQVRDNPHVTGLQINKIKHDKPRHTIPTF